MSVYVQVRLSPMEALVVSTVQEMSRGGGRPLRAEVREHLGLHPSSFDTYVSRLQRLGVFSGGEFFIPRKTSEIYLSGGDGI